MAKEKKNLPKRTLIVTQVWEISRGESDHGEWVLSGVKATDAEGAPVEQELRTFKADEIKVGEPLIYELERKEHEKYGVQYMVYPPRKDLKKSFDELRKRVDALEHEVAELRRMVPNLGSQSEAKPPQPSEPADPGPPDLGSRGPGVAGANTQAKVAEQRRKDPNDDIPF